MLLRVLGVLSGVVMVGASMAASATAVDGPMYRNYVALGDSAASVGSLNSLKSGAPLFCARSADNYPSVLAERLGVSRFTDVSCGGAKSEHMTKAQNGFGGSNPAQFESLTPDTDLVTITIGANDIGGTALLSAPGITTEQQDLVTRNVIAVLDGIHQRAPRATVVITDYIRYLPPDGPGCFGFRNNGAEEWVQRTLASLAPAHGAIFADSFAATGHDMCQPAGVNWANGPVPNSLSVPLHPNAAGQAHVAAVIAQALGH